MYSCGPLAEIQPYCLRFAKLRFRVFLHEELAGGYRISVTGTRQGVRLCSHPGASTPALTVGRRYTSHSARLKKPFAFYSVFHSKSLVSNLGFGIRNRPKSLKT